MDSTPKSTATCFYLGLLPKSANRNTLLSALGPLGKVLRIRVAREQADLACKGYGYAWVEPHASPVEFSRGCLELASPVIAFPIKGPKLLGCENTKFLRRFARVEGIQGKLSIQQIFSYMQSFGPVAFVATEFDQHSPDFIHRVHVLFGNETSASDLGAIQHHTVDGHLVEIHTYVGQQESPFEAAANSMTVVVFSGLPDMEIPSRFIRQELPAHSFRFNQIQEIPRDLGGAKIKNDFSSFSNHSQVEMKKGITVQTCSKLESARVKEQISQTTMAYPFAIQNLRGIEKEQGIHSQDFRAIASLESTHSTLSRCHLQRFGSILRERHSIENLRFNVLL